MNFNLPGRCSRKVRPGRCRNGHNDSWDCVAHREHELLHEPAHAGVVDHSQVACSEEEVQALQQHPGEGGQVEVVKGTRDDGTQHLGVTRCQSHQVGFSRGSMALGPVLYLAIGKTCVVYEGIVKRGCVF